MTGKAEPKVSVIMNCLNGEKYLRQALDSVYAQTFTDWEVIFWEDRDSVDKSGEIAESYGSKVRRFKAEEKLPLYGARNRAIEKAKGRYIAILDCDDIWMSTKLEEQIELFEKDKEVKLVCCDTVLFNERGEEKRLFGFKRPARGRVFEEILVNNFITTSSAVFFRDALPGKAPFDDRLHMSGDYDAWLKISQRWKIDYVDKPLAKYRVHSESITWTEGRRLNTVELGIIVSNLEKAIDNFSEKYPEGKRLLLRRQNVQKALSDWEKDHNSSARRLIKPYLCDGKTYLALYLLMYLPYRRAYHWCYGIYNKNLIA